MVYDIAVIGAGVVGSLIARTLSRYELKTVLIEKSSDVATGTTKANSGIVHAGFDAKNGTLKAKLNVKGCAMMESLCKELHVPYEKNGSLVVAFDDAEMETIKVLYDRGIANGVPEMEIIGKDALCALEPNISDKAVGALHAKSAGIVSPYELAIAAAECAVSNGVELVRNFEVSGVSFADGEFTIKGNCAPDCKCGCESTGEIKAKLVINTAGLFADDIAKMFDGEVFETVPRLGEYGLLDRSVADLCHSTIFQCPNEMGKGILVTPTTHHNILVGPSAANMTDKEDVSVRVGELRKIFKVAAKSVPSVSMRDMITSFAGLRSHLVTDDFYIDKSKTNDKFINLVGIESPGLASSPAIAEYVREMVVDTLGSEPTVRADFDPSRKAPVIFRELPKEEQRKLIEKDPAYARIVCRCETITEGEIRDAVRAPAGAIDVDGVKRRTRAGMGRCQGGFCGSKVMEIISKELDKPINQVSKFGGKSDIIYERTK